MVRNEDQFELGKSELPNKGVELVRLALASRGLEKSKSCAEEMLTRDRVCEEWRCT